VRTRAVLVVHSEALVAEALASALSRYPLLGPVAIATTSRLAIQCAAMAEVAVVDDALDRAGETVRALHRAGLRVVVLGDLGGDDEGIVLSRDASVEDLAAALSPGLKHVGNAADALTPREREVLSLVADGLPAKQVARRLGISEKTVEGHKSRVFAKLGVSNQTAAVSAVLTSGMGRVGWQSWNRSRI